MLIFHAQNAPRSRWTGSAARSEKRYPSPEESTVASVVDLSLVPPFFGLSARTVLAVSYRQAVASLPREADPADDVVILATWTARITRDYDARGADLVPS